MQWLHVRELASLAGCAQFMFLAIKPARLYLRELHDELRTKDSWSGRAKMTRQLRRDLEWWVAVLQHSNRRSIYKPVETAYMHVDSSGYGWGAVLNETTEAREFLGSPTGPKIVDAGAAAAAVEGVRTTATKQGSVAAARPPRRGPPAQANDCDRDGGGISSREYFKTTRPGREAVAPRATFAKDVTKDYAERV
eukprot:jgi/Tetstr1/425988/TSEL_016337.t1